jgi:sugar phosphate isomerase/epimerase
MPTQTPKEGASRRDFLALAAATAAATAATGLGTAAAASRERRLKLGIASYSLRKFPLERVLEVCRHLDVRYLTLKDMHLPLTDTPAQIQQALREIEAAGITLMGGGVIYMKNDPAAARKAFEYARLARFPLIVGAPDPDALDLVEGLAREFDMRVAVHNHGPEDKSYPAPQDAYALIKGRDARIGLCIDVGHTMRAGVEPVAAVRECRDRVFDLHLKDLAVKTDKDSQVPVGRGVLDVPGLFRALLEIGFSGHAALEYEIEPDDPVAGMRESLAYMRGVLDGLA